MLSNEESLAQLYSTLVNEESEDEFVNDIEFENEINFLKFFYFSVIYLFGSLLPYFLIYDIVTNI